MSPTTFGPTVRAAREAAKLSQNAIAQALGMNRMYYSLFEAGRYVINEDEVAALRDFLGSHGIDLPSVASSEPDASAGRRSGKDAGGMLGDVRIASGKSALARVSELAKLTGVDSKRTAGAVSAAMTSLQELDYRELIALANDRLAPTEGLLDESTFTGMQIEGKTLWEGRAVGMVVCAALYGPYWAQASCAELRLIREAMRRLVDDDSWEVRDRGFFESDEKYLPDLRCQLAPLIAKAAESRRAPALS